MPKHTLAGKYGDEAADKVQELVNRMVQGTWAPGQPLPAGYESNECVVKAPAGDKSDNQSDGTAHQSSDNRQSTQQRHHATKVWIVDRDGHFEPVFQDVPVRHEAVVQTREHPALTRTERVKVRDAWDEKVTHPAEYKEVSHPAQTHVERVLVTPEHTVRHEAEYRDKVVIDKEAWTEKVKVKDAWTETVHHKAEYQDRVVIDKAAWDEKVKVRDAWDEKVVDVPAHTVNHPEQSHVEKVLVKPAWDERIPAKYGDRTVVDKPAWSERVKVKDAWSEQVLVRAAWTENVQHPAEYKTVHHDAVTHVERVKVKDAWDETKLVVRIRIYDGMG
ncbi:hypothetical protein, partial [Bifidobacterium jacchi]